MLSYVPVVDLSGQQGECVVNIKDHHAHWLLTFENLLIESGVSSFHGTDMELEYESCRLSLQGHL